MLPLPGPEGDGVLTAGISGVSLVLQRACHAFCLEGARCPQRDTKPGCRYSSPGQWDTTKIATVAENQSEGARPRA